MTPCSSRSSTPVGDSLALSALCAPHPARRRCSCCSACCRMKAWIAGLISLRRRARGRGRRCSACRSARRCCAATEGAAFGFFPILWIVINAIWVYNLTVATGHFDVLRRSFEKVSPDQRIQAIIIAFCFGALLEALAGFGTPVAITVVMLMALGFQPIKAAAVALVANTAPVAFGALAIPIVTLATVTSGVSDDPRPRRRWTRSARWSAGRRRSWRVVVPLILVFVVDGRRGVRQTWLPALRRGRRLRASRSSSTSNYISVQLTDIVASLLGRGSLVAAAARLAAGRGR